MKLASPGETAEYRAARDKLLDQEIALRRQMEALAVARRALPAGGLIPPDSEFETMRAGEGFADRLQHDVPASQKRRAPQGADGPDRKPSARRGPLSVLRRVSRS